MLQQFLQEFGYFALFLGTFFEGETILVLAGFLAFRGYMDLKLVMIVAFLGSYAGDQLWYFLGRKHGRKLLARKPRWQLMGDRALEHIRRHPDIKLTRQPDDIAALALLQGELLDALWKTLEVGGILLYATCSTLPTENTEVIEAFLARTPGARELDLATTAGIKQPHGRQLLAQEGGHDGFYYAKLIKIAAARG